MRHCSLFGDELLQTPKTREFSSNSCEPRVHGENSRRYETSSS